MKNEIKKLDKSRLEITGELAADIFEGYRARALAHLGAHIEIDGFRKGHIPENVLLKHIPENMLHEEMAEMALADHYPKILETEKIDAIGKPHIAITKLAKDNPLGYKITTAVLPEVKLPDYKKLAKESMEEQKPIEVEEKEIQDTIMQIRRLRAHDELHKHEESGEHVHEHNHDPIKDEDLPPFDDEYVKKLGAFETVEQFKEKLKENIRTEKEKEAKSTKRLKAIEAILKEVKVDVPDILVDSELMKMMFRLKTDVENAGLSFEDYLKNLNKTEDDIKKEWTDDATKKATLELVIFEIAKKESLAPSEDEIAKEVEALMNYYKGADRERAYAYVQQVLTHEKVFEFLGI